MEIDEEGNRTVQRKRIHRSGNDDRTRQTRGNTGETKESMTKGHRNVPFLFEMKTMSRMSFYFRKSIYKIGIAK